MKSFKLNGNKSNSFNNHKASSRCNPKPFESIVAKNKKINFFSISAFSSSTAAVAEKKVLFLPLPQQQKRNFSSSLPRFREQQQQQSFSPEELEIIQRQEDEARLFRIRNMKIHDKLVTFDPDFPPQPMNRLQSKHLTGKKVEKISVQKEKEIEIVPPMNLPFIPSSAEGDFATVTIARTPSAISTSGPPPPQSSPSSPPLPPQQQATTTTKAYPFEDLVGSNDDPVIRMTTLSNKLRVATFASPKETITSTISINFHAGIADGKKPGVAQFVEKLLFERSKKYPQGGRYLSDIFQELGASVNMSTDREYATMTFEVFSERFERLVDIVGDCVSNPIFQDDGLQEARSAFSVVEAENAENPESTLIDWMLGIAYGQDDPIARPSIPPEDVATLITKEDLYEYVREHFSNRNAVIVGTGVDHDAFCALVERCFSLSDTPSKNEKSQSKSQWVGGERRVQFLEQPVFIERTNMVKMTHAIVGMPGPAYGEPGFYAMNVLQSHLGGGTSFSSGGPGKGILTRLYRDFLCRIGWLDRIEAAAFTFSCGSLFGFYSAAPHEHAQELVSKVLAPAIRTMDQGLSPQALSRAKNQLKSKVLMRLEARALFAAEVGLNLVSHDKILHMSEFCRKVDAVTLDEIKQIADKLRNEKNPLLLVVGDEKKVDSYEKTKKLIAEGPPQKKIISGWDKLKKMF